MLTLTDGDTSVVIAPEAGAGVLGWMRGRTPLLRRALPQAALGDAHAMGCFPLLPYANRIGGARFDWLGRSHGVARNFGDSPHSIHGIGWQRAWRLESVSGRAVRLGLGHGGDGAWPFAFEASLTYRLDGPALHVAIGLTSRHTDPAPAGIGLHPYFPKVPGASLRFDASGVWENGADVLPLRHGPVPSAWSHAMALPVGTARLDNCFTGWDGSADIDAGAASLRVRASGVFGRLQVFTPDWADFFCVEPVSHAPDGVNREDGMHVLRPGETLSGTVAFLPAG